MTGGPARRTGLKGQASKRLRAGRGPVGKRLRYKDLIA